MVIAANFTPWLSLGGGMLIGLGTIMLLYFNGKIAGISGILGGSLFPQKNDWSWRVLFIVGLISGGAVISFWLPEKTAASLEISPLLAIMAGFLVGLGTRMGSGCTSGHGICGLARRSPRSFLATLTFMLFGFLTVTVLRHVFGGGL